MTIEDILEDIVAEIVADVDTATMFLYLKSGLRRIPANIRSRMFLTEATLPLSASAYTLNLSSLSPKFSRERAIWYVDSEGKRQPITKLTSPQEFHRHFNPASYGKPTFYRIYGTTLNFDKRADAALTIGFDYFKKAADVTTSDEIDDEEMMEAVKEYAKAIYYQDYEKDANSAIIHGREAEKILNGIQGQYEEDEGADRVEETEDY